LPAEAARYRSSVQTEDCETAVVWASEAIDLIDAVDDAGRLVERIGTQAEELLRNAPHWSC
jgi:hypothetical protein